MFNLIETYHGKPIYEGESQHGRGFFFLPAERAALRGVYPDLSAVRAAIDAANEFDARCAAAMYQDLSNALSRGQVGETVVYFNSWDRTLATIEARVGEVVFLRSGNAIEVYHAPTGTRVHAAIGSTVEQILDQWRAERALDRAVASAEEDL